MIDLEPNMTQHTHQNKASLDTETITTGTTQDLEQIIQPETTIGMSQDSTLQHKTEVAMAGKIKNAYNSRHCSREVLSPSHKGEGWEKHSGNATSCASLPSPLQWNSTCEAREPERTWVSHAW